jgi:hypothetical protein
MGRKHHRSVAFVEQARIEFVMLANHAEAINGLLYISGGGWADHRRVIVPGQPVPPSPISIALSLYIPWNDTNRPHALSVTVESEDGAVLFKVDASLNTGRPPQLPPGAPQNPALAFNGIVTYPKAGGYRVIAKLNGDQDTRTWPFRVHDIPQQSQIAS